MLCEPGCCSHIIRAIALAATRGKSGKVLRPSNPEKPDFRTGPDSDFSLPVLWPSDYKSSTSFEWSSLPALCSFYLSPISLLIQAQYSCLEADIWNKSYCSENCPVSQCQCFMSTSKPATRLKSFLSTFEKRKYCLFRDLSWDIHNWNLPFVKICIRNNDVHIQLHLHITKQTLFLLFR